MRPVSNLETLTFDNTFNEACGSAKKISKSMNFIIFLLTTTIRSSTCTVL